jgi:alginate O-acetyltransferase complex protein AlgI
VNLLIVMLLGGLWHGASWNFVIWGGLHGLLLSAERLRGKRALYGDLPAPIRTAITFTVVLVTWVFFRSPDLPHALRYLGDMFAVAPVSAAAGLLAGVVYQPYYAATFAAAAVIVWSAPQTWDWTRVLTMPKAAVALALFALSVVMLTTQAYNPFIYFIF